MNMQRIGGWAAIVEAAAYGFGIAVGFSALAAFMGGTLDPSETVAFIGDHHSLLYVWNTVIYLLFGVALVVLVIALHQRLEGAAPGLVNTATAFGLVWAGLVLASGMIFNVGMDVVIDLHAAGDAGAASTWIAISAVQDGLGGGNELVGGVWTLLVSWAALRAKVLPRGLNGLGMIVGVAGIVTILPAASSLGIVFGLGQLVWFAWLGAVMTRSAVVDRRTSPLGRSPRGVARIHSDDRRSHRATTYANGSKAPCVLPAHGRTRRTRLDVIMKNSRTIARSSARSCSPHSSSTAWARPWRRARPREASP